MNKFYPKYFFVFCIFFLAFNQKSISQVGNDLAPNPFKKIQLIAGDSIIGFDEANYKNQALNDDFFGSEYYVFMYNRVREYINTKYNLNPNLNQNQNQGGGNQGGKGGGGGGQIYSLPCVNEDFELNNFSGWTVTSGNNSNSCAYNLCPTAGSPEAAIRTTPWADVNFPGNLPNSPLGGTRVAQLNNNTPGVLVTRIAQTFPVTGNNALFQFAYAAVFNGAHACCQRPFLAINVKNCLGQVLTCPQMSVVAPGGVGCGPAAPGFTTVGAISKCLWQLSSIDLSQYIGSCVTIEVTVGDCSGGAHQGYVYFDALCSPLNFVINGNVFPAGTQATTVTACGALTATVTGPPGLAPYLWNGPPGSGIVNNPNQTFTTTTAGQYTLTLTPPGACTPAVKYVTILFAPNPIAGMSITNMCNVFTFSNTGSPAPSVQTYSFAGPAPPPGFTTTATSTAVVFGTPGIYTVTQVITTTAGCTASVTATITVPPAPNVMFAINNATQCLTGNSFSFTAADPSGIHSYSFSPGLGAPPIGNLPNYGLVSFSLPGTYTVTHSVTSGGCTSYTTSVVLINPQPTPTVSNNGPVCLNTTILLSALGGNTYAWSGPLGFTSGVQNPTITNASFPMSGPYTVTVTSGAGCTSTAVTNVTVVALPVPVINSNSPVCFGSTLSFTGSGGTTYTWTGPNTFTSGIQNPNIPNVSLLASGIYTMMVAVGSCTASTTASITINPLPVATATNNSPVCLNQTLLLIGGGGTQYAWAGPSGYVSAIQNPTVAVASLTNTGIYTVTVTDANTCVNTVTTSVIVNSLPILAVNNPSACINSTIFLTANGAATYAWSGPLAYVSIAQNPAILNATLPMTGQYTVIGTSAQGCTSSAVSNVSVSPSPTAIITSNSPVCFGASLTLNGSGGSSYSWTGPNGFVSANQNNTINNVTLPASGNYDLIVTANTCTSLATASITINALPVPVIQMNYPVCFSQAITFSASGGSTYLWNGPGAFTSNSPIPVIPNAQLVHSGVFTLTATDVNGCVNSSTASALVLPLPSIAIQGGSVCLGQTASLSVVSDPGATYQWTGPNGFSSTQTSTTFPNFTYAMAGQYTVAVTGTNQCTDISVTTVSNHPVPTPTASNNGPVCFNGKVDFQSAGGLVYQWTGPNGFLSNSQNTSLLSADNMLYNGTFTLGVIDARGCQGFTTTNLVVRALPTATLASNVNNFCVPFCTTFSIASSNSLASVQWNMNDGSFLEQLNYSSCFKEVGAYVIKSKYIDAYGCTNSNSFVINAYPKPIADFHYGPGLAKENDQIEFLDESRGKDINGWTWYFGSNYKISFDKNPVYVYSEPGTYPVALVVKNKWGCIDTVVKPVIIGEDFGVFVPNAFSPNNDGLNDVFQPKGHGVVKYNIMIFDRWGEKIFQTADFTKGWDGTFKGQPCKTDTYVWKIIIQNSEGKSKELSGIVTIVE